MRNLCMVLSLVGLLASLSPGAINIKLTADAPLLSTGQTTTVRILAQGTAAGIASVAGNINALGTTGLLNSDAGSLAWVPAFASGVDFPKQVGTAGTNGGWNAFGSQQTNYLAMDPNYGKTGFVEVASYTVTATSGVGQVSLSFLDGRVTGFKCVETDESSVMNTPAQVIIGVNVPEPLTISLLALGGLVAARRRSR